MDEKGTTSKNCHWFVVHRFIHTLSYTIYFYLIEITISKEILKNKYLEVARTRFMIAL